MQSSNYNNLICPVLGILESETLAARLADCSEAGGGGWVQDDGGGGGSWLEATASEGGYSGGRRGGRRRPGASGR
jgi:hypothetical protein